MFEFVVGTWSWSLRLGEVEWYGSFDENPDRFCNRIWLQDPQATVNAFYIGYTEDAWDFFNLSIDYMLERGFKVHVKF